MQEELVSFETAKLAKEKGFDLEFCNVGWHGDFGDLKGDNYPFLGTYSFYKSIYCNNKDEHQIQRPTQSLLQKWLREVHKISVESTSCWWDDGKKEFEYNVYKKDLGGDSPCSLSVFKTYEEALEVGLQEALKLIEIVKKQKEYESNIIVNRTQ